MTDPLRDNSEIVNALANAADCVRVAITFHPFQLLKAVLDPLQGGLPE